MNQKNNSNSFRSKLVLLEYRINHKLYVKKHRWLCTLLHAFWELLKPILNINCQISYKAIIGDNVRLPHRADGVIISSKAIIGNNVTIYHQVTIGINENLPLHMQRVIIKDNVYISSGAKIISCTVGKNAKIGPNAVVYKDIPDNTRLFAMQLLKDSL